MSMQANFESKKRLPLIDTKADLKANVETDIEAELDRFEKEERARLGLAPDQHWVEDMANLGFTKSQRSKVTLLVGGLTMAHDYLVEGGLKSLGYDVLSMDAPDNDALRVGKEFGNRAQCNPTYFTVGNLVKFLIQMRDEKGMTKQEIIDRFVFVTAGACGPCRFGMYVTEYRKALRDAGFDGFRVMLFQQQGGLSQATGEESGLELNPAFFMALIRAIMAGDVLNALAYRIRPYELEAGATDRAMTEAKEICHAALSQKKSVLTALFRARKAFAKVKVDRTRVKPRVAVIGEFWAMTTEGDGNYQLQKFLEAEGSEVDIQIVTAWLLYNIWEVSWDTANRATLRGTDGGRFGLAELGDYGVMKRKAGLWAAEKALRGVFKIFATAGGLYDFHLANMQDVADVAAPFYNNDLRGGEGHMEVGKLILNVVKQKATMTLSVKPFGCMPSSGVSDGVQSIITERYPGTIYCAVETSGDGAVNFYSRVQMYLFKAKQAAEADVLKALEKSGVTMDEVRGYLAKHPRFGSALHRAPHAAACTTADLVHEVAHVIKTPAWKRALDASVSGARTASKVAVSAVKGAPKFALLAGRAGAELVEIARDEKALERVKNRMISVMMKAPEAGESRGFAAAAG